MKEWTEHDKTRTKDTAFDDMVSFTDVRFSSPYLVFCLWKSELGNYAQFFCLLHNCTSSDYRETPWANFSPCSTQESKDKAKTEGIEEEEEKEIEKLGHDTSVAHSGDDDGLNFHTPNMSMEECSSLNTTYNPNHTMLNTTSGLNTSQMHWSQLKCDYR